MCRFHLISYYWLFVIGIFFNSSVNGQPGHQWSVGTNVHYSNNSSSSLLASQDRVWQPSVTFQWHKFLYAGAQGWFDRFEHELNNRQKESGLVWGVGPVLGGNIPVFKPFHVNPEISLTLGKGHYTPPVPDQFNNHPRNKVKEREYRYTGLNVSLGVVARSLDRLDVELRVQYTYENWHLQPFDGIQNPDYPLVSPDVRKYHVLRWQVGVRYRFSVFHQGEL